jgi:type IV secretion system protein VirD4
MTTATSPARRRIWPKVLAAVALLILAAVALHQDIIAVLIAIAALAVTVLVLRARWASYKAGGRIAAWKRRRYQGWAGRRDVRRAARSAWTLTRRLSPGTPLLILGTRRRQPVAVCRENSALYIGPPGTGKTGTLACHAADAPGALFATSTKTELLLDTIAYRPGGRIWILNADGYGNIPTTLAWDPLEGCRSAAGAIRRAGDMIAASPRDQGGKDAWHEDRGARLLRYMLHAAAIAGASMHEVVTWVNNPLSAEPMTILSSPAAEPGWAGKLEALLAESADSLGALVSSASAAIGWMDDPVMAAAATPPPGEGFSAWEFARSSDSVYLIGRNRPYGSLAPYFAALGAEIFEQLKWHAMESPSGRLAVPATYVLDEMPLTCPMPVHDMLAEARGYLITLTMGVQSISQLRARWGPDDGDTIRSACPVEVFLGGEKRHADLEAASAVIGARDTWTGSGGVRTPGSERLLPPEALHRLRKGQGVILMPECKPVLAALQAIWARPGHQRADLGHATRLLGRPAIPAYARPAVADADPVPALEVPAWPNAPR